MSQFEVYTSIKIMNQNLNSISCIPLLLPKNIIVNFIISIIIINDYYHYFTSRYFVSQEIADDLIAFFQNILSKIFRLKYYLKNLFYMSTAFIHRIFETNSSFYVKQCTRKKFQFLFFKSFSVELTTFSFWKENQALGYHSIKF